VLFDLLLTELLADLVERLDGLWVVSKLSNVTSVGLSLTLSRTRGSSMVARFSRGERRQWPKSGPPTYSTNPPNSSLRAVRTSSSSSTDSVQKSAEAIGVLCEYMRTIEERYQLIASALRAQSEGNGGESADGIQAEKDIVMLCGMSVPDIKHADIRYSNDSGRRRSRTLSSSMSTAIGYNSSPWSWPSIMYAVHLQLYGR